MLHQSKYSKIETNYTIIIHKDRCQHLSNKKLTNYFKCLSQLPAFLEYFAPFLLLGGAHQLTAEVTNVSQTSGKGNTWLSHAIRSQHHIMPDIWGRHSHHKDISIFKRACDNEEWIQWFSDWKKYLSFVVLW